MRHEACLGVSVEMQCQSACIIPCNISWARSCPWWLTYLSVVRVFYHSFSFICYSFVIPLLFGVVFTLVLFILFCFTYLLTFNTIISQMFGGHLVGKNETKTVDTPSPTFPSSSFSLTPSCVCVLNVGLYSPTAISSNQFCPSYWGVT